MKIIFCGFARAGKEALEYLLQSGIPKESIHVFTTEGEKNAVLSTFLTTQHMPFSTDTINDHLAEVEKHPDALLLSIYYPYIISGEILHAVKYRAMNLHPALLPRYRGCFSAPWVIINGEKETGVTYHYMLEGVDKGKILIQERIPIRDDHTGVTLYNDLVDLGMKHFPLAFERLSNAYEGEKQKGEASWYKREVPFGGYIDLSWPKDKIYRYIRAMHFPPLKGALLQYQGEEHEFHTPEAFTAFAEKNSLKIS